MVLMKWKKGLFIGGQASFALTRCLESSSKLDGVSHPSLTALALPSSSVGVPVDAHH